MGLFESRGQEARKKLGVMFFFYCVAIEPSELQLQLQLQLYSKPSIHNACYCLLPRKQRKKTHHQSSNHLGKEQQRPSGFFRFACRPVPKFKSKIETSSVHLYNPPTSNQSIPCKGFVKV